MIGLIGAGHMGRAILDGLIGGGLNPSGLVVATRREEHATQLREELGVQAVTEPARAARGADIVIVATRVDQVPGVLEELSETLAANTQDTVVVSVAAGLTVAHLEEHLEAGTSVVRAMPNTPMALGKGVVVYTPGKRVSPEQEQAVVSLFERCAVVQRIEEKQMDAATSLIGSSPAYVYLMAEALIDAGVALGIPREAAARMANNTIAGAGEVLTQPGVDAASLRAAVCSPGGTTAAAVRELEESGFRGMFYRATEACTRRANDLGSH
ncbi:pyrroline-5-carboxylate reductase [Corynebacterium renale]|uniref:pyrroline-5-carboxylate reductase n=1 Tax=Corynebacterium renale TaxID=1724 RepID=UPI000DA349DB|nr:pyrroline-5-carboxylate reductase [Corynebacterium renale]SQG63932.1 pyrroline-5-carboxylate reductase [Corynebacterium renale]STD03019.1 pyrroline-5-carboxylate reductase [Corynebacterium renale]